MYTGLGFYYRQVRGHCRTGNHSVGIHCDWLHDDVATGPEASLLHIK